MTIRDAQAIPLRIGFRETFRFGTIDCKQSQNVVLVVTTDADVLDLDRLAPDRFSRPTSEPRTETPVLL